jgi:3-methylcrotonyl-CoA carboxylase alpha subunit
MLKKILIANRGEIALRIMRTARRLGVQTVAVVSEADRNAPHARCAEEVVEIGAGPATESYLRGDVIIAAARRTGAEGIHPGYGFLAENAAFAAAVAAAGMKFIGPSPEAMRRMGEKAEAKAIAAKAGVPVVPGYQGDAQTAQGLSRQARRIGYPLLIKAVAGGGGRGMRLVDREADFAALLEGAQREATAAFGDPRVLLERLIERPRHIEVQIFGDGRGNVVHLFERDCSLQRRNQKVIEEAPAPDMPDELREKLTAAAVACARAVGYEGAGTVEFLVEGGALTAHAPWYFIEMNTRLQVEHPVTEAITGVDLVEWQLRVASGEAVPRTQEAIAISGHAIEARLNAEDPASDFRPSCARIVAFEPPAGVRVDAGVVTGSLVSPYYDPLLAKLIAHAADRRGAIAKLKAALDGLVLAGPKSNADFLFALLGNPAVERGTMDTGLIGREIAELAPARFDSRLVAAGVARLLRGRVDEAGGPASPWDAGDAFQLGAARTERRTVLVDGAPLVVEIDWRGGQAHPRLLGDYPPPPPTGLQSLRVIGESSPVYVLNARRQIEVGWPQFAADALKEEEASTLRAPITGRIVKLFARPGDVLAKGDPIAAIEAMKMEHVLAATRAGRLTQLAIEEGAQVTEGTLIAALADA